MVTFICFCLNTAFPLSWCSLFFSLRNVGQRFLHLLSARCQSQWIRSGVLRSSLIGVQFPNFTFHVPCPLHVLHPFHHKDAKEGGSELCSFRGYKSQQSPACAPKLRHEQPHPVFQSVHSCIFAVKNGDRFPIEHLRMDPLLHACRNTWDQLQYKLSGQSHENNQNGGSSDGCCPIDPWCLAWIMGCVLSLSRNWYFLL